MLLQIALGSFILLTFPVMLFIKAKKDEDNLSEYIDLWTDFEDYQHLEMSYSILE